MQMGQLESVEPGKGGVKVKTSSRKKALRASWMVLCLLAILLLLYVERYCGLQGST